jgi:hypothetical protein
VAVAVRFQSLGCALLGVLALAGCGGSGSSATGSDIVTSDQAVTTTVKPRPGNGGRAPRPTAGGSCQSQLGSFVASMDSLRRRLAVGLTYDEYVAEVRGIRSTYEKIPIDRVELDCLRPVGTPAEQAFNRYIKAANDWGECVSEAGCSSASVEPVLQRRWRVASHFLSAADAGLNASAP